MGLSKVVPLADAMREHVQANDHVHLGYSEARPNAAVLALVRRFLDDASGAPPRLTVSSGGLVSSQAALISEGLVARLIASFVGDNYPNGAPNPLFQRAIDSGSVVVEEVTLWTGVARLMAGALGLPFLPVRSLAGTDLAAQDWVRTIRDDGADTSTVAVQAMRPDVTIVHGVAADTAGNVILSPPYGEAAWGALAAKRGVIAVVEEVLDDVTMRKYQALVAIPSHVVRAVCVAPFGAHPYGLYSPVAEVASYVEDEAFILDQRRACIDDDTQRAWVAEWIRGLADHDAYLEHLGHDRLHRLAGAAAPGIWRLDADSPTAAGLPARAEEIMVLEAASLIDSLVRERESDVLMTGIGFANLAAWLAHRRLLDDGVELPLMAEIGAYGYVPRQGDPFIFSHRNLPTCSWLTGVGEILGAIVASGQGRALAVLGAGTVDAMGNTNSSRSAAGNWLVGSGGANDIASGAAGVVLVIKHGRTRLVERVPFVTCRGDNVVAIVTNRCVLQRSVSGEFLMTRVLVEPGSTPGDCAADAATGIGWDCAIADDLVAFGPVDDEQLQLLRSFDPRHAYLPEPAIATSSGPR